MVKAKQSELKKYRAGVNVLGLKVGETFESANKFYDIFVERGYLSIVNEEEPDGDQGGEAGSTEGGAVSGIGEGSDEGGTAGSS